MVLAKYWKKMNTPKSQTVRVKNSYHVYPIDKNGIERKWRYARQSAEEIKGLLRAKKTNSGYEIEIGKKLWAIQNCLDR